MAEHEGRTVSRAQADDEQTILDMLIPRAQARIDAQLHDSDALDAKALGVLGVTAAALALMVAVRSDVHPAWSVPTAALGVAGVLLLAAIWPRRFDVGPDPRRFYEAMATSTRLDASRQMLSELLAAIDENDRHQPGKNRLFEAGFAVLVLALLGRRPHRVANIESMPATANPRPNNPHPPAPKLPPPVVLHVYVEKGLGTAKVETR